MWLRLRQVALVARDLAPVVDELRAMFGLEVGYRDPGVAVFGLHNALLPVGSQFIEIVAPTRPGTAGGRYLERRGGDGGYMVILQCDEHARRKRRADQLKIRRALEQDAPDYKIMQLHPKDTGGTFLEIDYQAGGEAPDGPWHPAGHNWKAAVRTGIVRGIAAAEIQSPQRDGLAERWSQILELPLSRDQSGNPTLKLDNAALRFVPDRDGRGEGLGGIDLIAADRAHLLTAATQRGCRGAEGAIMIGGIRFRPVDASPPS